MTLESHEVKGLSQNEFVIAVYRKNHVNKREKMP